MVTTFFNRGYSSCFYRGYYALSGYPFRQHFIGTWLLHAVFNKIAQCYRNLQDGALLVALLVKAVVFLFVVVTPTP